MTVMRVAVDNIMPLWPQIEPLIAEALSVCQTHDTEDVRRMLLAQSAQLWIQWEDRVLGLLITEFVSYPKGIWVRIWLAAAAQNAKLDYVSLYDTLSKWRDANGCRGFEALGRPGWLRKFPEFRVEGLVMRTGA